MHNEQVFTPKWMVELMLNKVGYIPSNSITEKHIIDNSCGDGAFLTEIVKRYIQSACINGFSKEVVIKGLETYIHGVEIDSELCRKTIQNLNKVAQIYSINNVNWDIVNSDIIDVQKKYWYKMDYIVGNPPYCRIHDVPQEKRQIYKDFCKFGDEKDKGSFDSYLMFFNIGYRMMNKNGKLIYITPSSWTNSLYCHNFRKMLCEKYGIISIIDMKHEKVFDNATTFTMITEIGNFYHNASTEVYEWDKNSNILKSVNNANIFDYYVNGNFYFKDNNTLQVIKNIDKEQGIKMFSVKNGFATLNDKLFIGDMSEMAGILDDENIIFCTKASKNILQSIIYPYNKEGKPLKFEELSIPIQNKLLDRAKRLEVDTTKENWYLYGRNQAINDVNKNKYAINNLIKTKEDIKLHYCCGEIGVYSGLYIISNDNLEDRKTRQFIEETINDEGFVEYVHSLGRYKNGGFSTFTSKELEKYLNYKWNVRSENDF